MVITYDDLVAKLHELGPRERHECHWVMNRTDFRALFVLGMGREPDDEKDELEKALVGSRLLGRLIVVDEDATEIRIVSDACTCIKHEGDGIDQIVVLPPDGCPKHDRKRR